MGMERVHPLYYPHVSYVSISYMGMEQERGKNYDSIRFVSISCMGMEQLWQTKSLKCLYQSPIWVWNPSKGEIM